MPRTQEDIAVEHLSRDHLLFVVPLVLIHLSCFLVLLTGWSVPAIVTFAVLTFLRCFGITAGYHRLLSHRSFRTTRTFQFVLACLGALAAQNGPLWWVGHHRHHHTHSDAPADVHSPRRSFFWGHMGWLFSSRNVSYRLRLVRDLSRLPELAALDRHYYLLHIGLAAALYVMGEALANFAPDWNCDGFQLVVWGICLSTVSVYHMVWSTNSVCHRFGSRRFDTPDDSRNNALVSLLVLGDGWHHNHHFAPYSARHGFYWWEFDPTYLILNALAKVGIVWDLKLPKRVADY